MKNSWDIELVTKECVTFLVSHRKAQPTHYTVHTLGKWDISRSELMNSSILHRLRVL